MQTSDWLIMWMWKHGRERQDMVCNIEKEICKSSAAIMQRVVLFSKYLRSRSTKDRFVSETHHQNGKQEWIHVFQDWSLLHNYLICDYCLLRKPATLAVMVCIGQYRNLNLIKPCLHGCLWAVFGEEKHKEAGEHHYSN